MGESPSKEKPLPDGVVPDDAEILLKLLFHVEDLQHSRIYFFLVAETIFFLAAATAHQIPLFVVTLSLAGLLTACLFTIVNLKHHWRVLWLSRKLESACPPFRRYVNFHSFRELVSLGCFNQKISGWTIIDETKSPVVQESTIGIFPPIFANTGFLFTWGLFVIIVFVWLVFLIYGVHEMFFPCPHTLPT